MDEGARRDNVFERNRDSNRDSVIDYFSIVHTMLPTIRRRRDERRFSTREELASAIRENFDGELRAVHVSFPCGMLVVTVGDALDEQQTTILEDLASRFAGHGGLIIVVEPDLVDAA